MPDDDPQRSLPDLAALLSGYTVPSGAADELLLGANNLRPVWRDFISYLNAIGPETCVTRFAKGDQYLRDVGVYFRRYSAASGEERDWPLSHVPVLLNETEWHSISEALIQRAELLEHVLADIYGPQTLISGGQIPAEVIAQNPGWLRPMVGIKPKSGYFLHHLAIEIGRNPDGSWFVLGDRTQAPSGAGFALENRRASAHMYSDFFPSAQVIRLTRFFRAFRDAMLSQCGSRDETPAILTPGPGNDTYFEHIYIARSLGLLLLEGEDLTVQDGQAMVRTVSGLLPVSMLWRRLDAQFADPVELNEDSQLGTPGLVDALRRGTLSLTNALGSGILETRALMAFMPQIAQTVLGGPLKMPNIATWWCGDPTARAYVQNNLDRMSLSRAMATGLPYDNLTFEDRPKSGLPEHWTSGWVGQEAVNLSTTPVFENGKLVPRPMTVRVFLSRTPWGWEAMPGGYARIGNDDSNSALALQSGGKVADVWVVSETEVPRETLQPTGEHYHRVPQTALPSRAADNMFWLGRYAERADLTIRLLRAYHRRLAEGELPDSGRLTFLKEFLSNWTIDLSPALPKALLSQFGAATYCASKVRDRFSVDAWVALSDLNKTLRQFAEKIEPGDDCVRAMNVLLRKLSGFGGLVMENMYRSTAWRFLEFGRALERASGMTQVLGSFTKPDAPSGCLDLALEAGDSIQTHQRLYLYDPNRSSVLDLLLLDLRNPRSTLFQIDTIRNLVPDLPTNPEQQSAAAMLGRQVGAIHEFLMQTPADSMQASDFEDINQRLNALAVSLSSTYLR